MFLGYCLDPVSHTWFPPIPLTTPEACWTFCLRYHASTPEIRIVDMDDFLVLHVQDHVVKLPLEAGHICVVDLRDGVSTVIPAAPGEPPAPPDPDLTCELCERQPWTQLARWHECLVCADCARTEPRPDDAGHS